MAGERGVESLDDIMKHCTFSNTVVMTVVRKIASRNISKDVSVLQDFRDWSPLLKHPNIINTLWTLFSELTERNLLSVTYSHISQHSKHCVVSVKSCTAVKHFLITEPDAGLSSEMSDVHLRFPVRGLSMLEQVLPTNPCLYASPSHAIASGGNSSNELSDNSSMQILSNTRTCHKDNLKPRNQKALLFYSEHESDRNRIMSVSEEVKLRAFQYPLRYYSQNSCTRSRSFTHVDCSHSYDDYNTLDQPVDYSLKYCEQNLENCETPYGTQQNNLNIVTDGNCEKIHSGHAYAHIINSQSRFPCVVKKHVSYGDYAETDLDQLTDYSIQYAEIDDDKCSLEDKISRSAESMNNRNSLHEDTLKTYCTEDTPYGTPYNFSGATSMSDLRKAGLSEESDKEDLFPHDHAGENSPSECNANTVSRADCHSPSEFIIVSAPNCYEGKTPENFSRTTSSISFNNLSYEEESRIKTKHSQSNLVKGVLLKPEGKVVTFEAQDHYIEDTPLMFSRSSSLQSMSSLEQHSVHDDRSSVISDFSHRTSGIISPSELPDSPAHTAPPSPRRCKNSEFVIQKSLGETAVFKTPPLGSAAAAAGGDFSWKNCLNTLTVCDELKGTFDDTLCTYNTEDTPANISHAGSHSNLSTLSVELEVKGTFDDTLCTYNTEDTPANISHAGSHSNLSALSVELEVKINPSLVEEKEEKHQNPEKESNDGGETKPPLSEEDDDDDDEGDEEILAACIARGMMGGNSRQSSHPVVLNNNMTPAAITTTTTTTTISGPHYMQDICSLDTVHTYQTEDTPASISHAGSRSDLSILSAEDGFEIISDSDNYTGYVYKPETELQDSTVDATTQEVEDQQDDYESEYDDDFYDKIVEDCIARGMRVGRQRRTTASTNTTTTASTTTSTYTQERVPVPCEQYPARQDDHAVCSTGLGWYDRNMLVAYVASYMEKHKIPLAPALEPVYIIVPPPSRYSTAVSKHEQNIAQMKKPEKINSTVTMPQSESLGDAADISSAEDNDDEILADCILRGMHGVGSSGHKRPPSPQRVMERHILPNSSTPFINHHDGLPPINHQSGTAHLLNSHGSVPLINSRNGVTLINHHDGLPPIHHQSGVPPVNHHSQPLNNRYSDTHPINRRDDAPLINHTDGVLTQNYSNIRILTRHNIPPPQVQEPKHENMMRYDDEEEEERIVKECIARGMGIKKHSRTPATTSRNIQASRSFSRMKEEWNRKQVVRKRDHSSEFNHDEAIGNYNECIIRGTRAPTIPAESSSHFSNRMYRVHQMTVPSTYNGVGSNVKLCKYTQEHASRTSQHDDEYDNRLLQQCIAKGMGSCRQRSIINNNSNYNNYIGARSASNNRAGVKSTRKDEGLSRASRHSSNNMTLHQRPS